MKKESTEGEDVRCQVENASRQVRDAFEPAWQRGDLSPEKIAIAIAEYRARETRVRGRFRVIASRHSMGVRRGPAYGERGTYAPAEVRTIHLCRVNSEESGDGAFDPVIPGSMIELNLDALAHAEGFEVGQDYDVEFRPTRTPRDAVRK